MGGNFDRFNMRVDIFERLSISDNNNIYHNYNGNQENFILFDTDSVMAGPEFGHARPFFSEVAAYWPSWRAEMAVRHFSLTAASRICPAQAFAASGASAAISRANRSVQASRSGEKGSA